MWAVVRDAVAAGVLLYAVAWLVWGPGLNWAEPVVVCTQPDSIVYEEGSSYNVAFTEPSFSLALSRGHPSAVVGRYDGTYGLPVELDPSTTADDLACRWQPDGVEIIEPDGTVHDVPAEGFIGGR